MTQKSSPFIEAKYGWEYGESGWNEGMDQNLVKFSFMFDRNVDGIVASLPSAVNGQAFYLTTDNRIYFAVGTTWYSTPTPKWFTFQLRSTGVTYQFNGTSLVSLPNNGQLSSQIQDIQVIISSLGTAAFQPASYFASQAALDLASAQANSYTDNKISALTKTSVGLSNVDNTSDLLKPISTATGLELQKRVYFVDAVSDLRAITNTTITRVDTNRYWSGLEGGGGSYLADVLDTTSLDNGGTVIVSSSGIRFKLLYSDKISVKQFGARGDFNKTTDTGTDDTVPIQKAHDNIPRGIDVFYPNGVYWVSSRIIVKGGSNIRFQSRSTATDNAKCAIIGSLGLDGIIEIQSGDSTFSVKVVNMVVTRRNGSFSNTSRGIILGGIDQTILEDCASFSHGIPIHVAGQLAPYLIRLNTWNCTGSHVKISTCVEPRFTNCRFGRNGNADQVCDSYILIDGSGGIQVDTVEFLGCQFNQSGALANSVIRFVNYNNPNGIFGFTDSHLEGWGTYVVLVDATTTRLQRLKFNGCTITSSGSQFMGGNTIGVIEDMQINGCTTAAIVTFNKVTSASISGGSLSGNLVIDSGNCITTGVRITGNATFVGTGKLTFAINQVSGTISDSFTGTKYVAGNI